MRSAKSKIVVSDLILVLAVYFFTLAPLICAGWLSPPRDVSVFEKRQLANLPSWPRSFDNWKHFPKAFDAYATDRFGFRSQLLNVYRWFVTGIFGNSISKRAFVGRQGWIFVNRDGSLADIQGMSAYTSTDLLNVVEQINARGELLAVRHIPFSFVVFPDKHTVYAEYLPHGVYGGFERRRLTALDAAMANTGHNFYTDTSNKLRADALYSPFRLYYKSDTHWNPWGAYLGYQAWVKLSNIDLGLKKLKYNFSQFRVPGRLAHGDLYLISGYNTRDIDIWPPLGLPCYPWHNWVMDAAWMRKLDVTPQLLRKTMDCDHGKGTALVLHDSFMDSIAWYVSENYARTYYLWKYLDDFNFGMLVRHRKPNVVLIERVERLMSSFPQANIDALVHELGIVGDSVDIASDGVLQVRTLGVAFVHSKKSVFVSTDRVVRKGRFVHVEGWARMGDLVPDAVLVIANGKIVAEAPVALYRPDVAEAQGNPKLTWSGFQLDIPGVDIRGVGDALSICVVNYHDYGVYPVSDAFRRRLDAASGMKKTDSGE